MSFIYPSNNPAAKPFLFLQRIFAFDLRVFPLFVCSFFGFSSLLRSSPLPIQFWRHEKRERRVKIKRGKASKAEKEINESQKTKKKRGEWEIRIRTRAAGPESESGEQMPSVEIQKFNLNCAEFEKSSAHAPPFVETWTRAEKRCATFEFLNSEENPMSSPFMEGEM